MPNEEDYGEGEKEEYDQYLEEITTRNTFNHI
jgi:hypothetical protein